MAVGLPSKTRTPSPRGLTAGELMVYHTTVTFSQGLFVQCLSQQPEFSGEKTGKIERREEKTTHANADTKGIHAPCAMQNNHLIQSHDFPDALLCLAFSSPIQML